MLLNAIVIEIKYCCSWHTCSQIECVTPKHTWAHFTPDVFITILTCISRYIITKCGMKLFILSENSMVQPKLSATHRFTTRQEELHVCNSKKVNRQKYIIVWPVEEIDTERDKNMYSSWGGGFPYLQKYSQPPHALWICVGNIQTNCMDLMTRFVESKMHLLWGKDNYLLIYCAKSNTYTILNSWSTMHYRTQPC